MNATTLLTMSGAEATLKPRSSLGRVLDDLGMTFLEIIHGRVDEAQHVGGVVIYDPLDEPAYPTDAIVLGVGVSGGSPLEELLRTLNGKPITAVVARTPVHVTPEAQRLADEENVVILGLARGATWTQLAAMLRSLLAEDDIQDVHMESLGGIPAGDLFAVANAISSLLDAPVTIEDRSSKVLAFSGRQEEVDASRAETILGRRVPERLARILTEQGVFRELYRSSEPIIVPPVGFGDGVSTQRVAIAVRAGDEVLGSVWAAMEGEITPERRSALADATKLVALHLLRARAGADVQRRLRADLVSTALEGNSGASEALARLGLTGQRACVITATPTIFETDGAARSDQNLIAERERFSDAFAVHLSAMQPGSAVALLGDTAFAIFPIGDGLSAEDAQTRVKRLAKDFLERVSPRIPAVIAVGPVADDIPGIVRSRSTALRILRILRERAPTSRSGGAPPLVACLSDVESDVMIMDLRDLVNARGDEHTGPVARLIAHDARSNGLLLETLRAWLDHFGDVKAASESLFVHPNTFRYRLRRVTEVGEIDLGDADARFTAMLQLRLLDVL